SAGVRPASHRRHGTRHRSAHYVARRSDDHPRGDPVPYAEARSLKLRHGQTLARSSGMMRRLCVTSALVAAIVVSPISAAGAQSAPAETWVPKVCTTLQQYQQTISDENDALTTSLQSVTSLKKARAKLVAFLGKAVDAAKTAKQQVQASGAPFVTNGD